MGNLVDYKGKRCVVIGASSGMGQALVKLLNEESAEVIALDVKAVAEPVSKYIPINLGDKRSVIDAAAKIPGDIDAYFHVAGMAGGGTLPFQTVIAVNYLGARLSVERLLPKMKKDSAMLIVSSIAGRSWPEKAERYKDIIMTDDWDEALKLIESYNGKEGFYNGTDSNSVYVFTKVLISLFGINFAWAAAANHVRVNLTGPGGTVTQLHKEFVKWAGLKEGSALPTSPHGIESVPEDQAKAMLMLNSGLAQYVSGQQLYVDYALTARVYK
jgi:NAD(P)-dependent dehydrogenase (short-subunit alcohol dehydrogenase family)